MKVHAIQTGFVRIKTAQVEGRGHGLARRLAIFTDRNWTDWLPTFAWVIDYPEDVIVVDTGQERICSKQERRFIHMSDGKSCLSIDHEEEIGPQLRALGIGLRDVKRVVLTHLHMDHVLRISHIAKS